MEISKNIKDIIYLSPELDTVKFRKEFTEQGFVRIPRILPENFARKIHKELSENLNWRIVYNDDKGNHSFPKILQKRKSAEDWDNIKLKMKNRVKEKKFQYFFESFDLSDVHPGKGRVEIYLSYFKEWLNLEQLRNLVFEITGILMPTPFKLVATGFGPGQFITMMNDFGDESKEKIGIIFNFSPDWQSEWGGVLQFLNRDLNEITCLTPIFNTLDIFALTLAYNTSFVVPFSPSIRYSIECRLS